MVRILRFHPQALLLACAVVAGCAHNGASPVAVTAVNVASRSGEVGATDISEFAAPSARLALADNETFFLPLAALDNPLPDYPQPLLAQRLPPRVICVEIAVGTQGEVMTAGPIAPSALCPVEGPGAQVVEDRRFFDAAREAVLRWRFDAAFRCEYPDDAARIRQDCSGGRETAQAVSLAYRFIFEQRDGRGLVQQAGATE